MDRDRRTLDAHLPLRPVEFHILLSLAAGERHGYGIIKDIQGRGETGVPDVGPMAFADPTGAGADSCGVGVPPSGRGSTRVPTGVTVVRLRKSGSLFAARTATHLPSRQTRSGPRITPA